MTARLLDEDGLPHDVSAAPPAGWWARPARMPPRISWLIHWINGARGLGRIAASSILTGFSPYSGLRSPPQHVFLFRVTTEPMGLHYATVKPCTETRVGVTISCNELYAPSIKLVVTARSVA
jgi:hypothetical protein